MAGIFKSFLKIDLTVLNYIQEHMVNPFLDKAMPFITHLGSGGAVWICLSLFFMATKKYRRTGIIAAAALILSLIVCNLLIKPFTARIRPFILGNPPDNLIINPPKDFSFPSGHTSASFAAAVSILLCGHSSLAYAALILAGLIGFSRLYLYVHYPSDVVFGALLGTLLAFSAYISVNLIFAKNGLC